jgi:hypothetical protein
MDIWTLIWTIRMIRRTLYVHFSVSIIMDLSRLLFYGSKCAAGGGGLLFSDGLMGTSAQ